MNSIQFLYLALSLGFISLILGAVAAYYWVHWNISSLRRELSGETFAEVSSVVETQLSQDASDLYTTSASADEDGLLADSLPPLAHDQTAATTSSWQTDSVSASSDFVPQSDLVSPDSSPVSSVPVSIPSLSSGSAARALPSEDVSEETSGEVQGISMPQPHVEVVQPVLQEMSEATQETPTTLLDVQEGTQESPTTLLESVPDSELMFQSTKGTSSVSPVYDPLTQVSIIREGLPSPTSN